jgi:hypothetical protein
VTFDVNAEATIQPDPSPSTSTTTQELLQYHERLGHMPFKCIQRLANETSYQIDYQSLRYHSVLHACIASC